MWETVPCRRSCIGKASLEFDTCPDTSYWPRSVSHSKTVTGALGVCFSRTHFPYSPCIMPSYQYHLPPSVWDSLDFYSRLDIDTLFFIFYYMEVSSTNVWFSSFSPMWGTPLPPCPFTSSSFPPLLFSFFHWLYLFSSFVHPFPFYQNSPTPFPGRRS